MTKNYVNVFIGWLSFGLFQYGKLSHYLPRQGLCGMEGSVGAYFNATVTSDTYIKVKIDLFFVRGNCLGRAVLPTLST